MNEMPAVLYWVAISRVSSNTPSLPNDDVLKSISGTLPLLLPGLMYPPTPAVSDQHSVEGVPCDHPYGMQSAGSEVKLSVTCPPPEVGLY
jgi:hypothetical protein